MKFVLCGFSGSGKSSLLQRVKWEGARIDLDRQVEGQTGQKISEIIGEKGEEHFRELEYQWLRTNLGRQEPLLIALGGGGLNEKTFELLSSTSQVLLVFVRASFEDCWKRISGDSSRPLTALGREEMLKRFAERQSWYERAPVVIHYQENGLEQMACELESILHQKMIF